MPDANHARNAKARASQMEHQGKLTAADKKKIDAKADLILKKYVRLRESVMGFCETPTSM